MILVTLIFIQVKDDRVIERFFFIKIRFAISGAKDCWVIGSSFASSPPAANANLYNTALQFRNLKFTYIVAFSNQGTDKLTDFQKNQ